MRLKRKFVFDCCCCVCVNKTESNEIINATPKHTSYRRDTYYIRIYIWSWVACVVLLVFEENWKSLHRTIFEVFHFGCRSNCLAEWMKVESTYGKKYVPESRPFVDRYRMWLLRSIIHAKRNMPCPMGRRGIKKISISLVSLPLSLPPLPLFNNDNCVCILEEHLLHDFLPLDCLSHTHARTHDKLPAEAVLLGVGCDCWLCWARRVQWNWNTKW